MPSFNFQKQFVPLVESGVKHTTIRNKRKNPPRPGQLAHLFFGLRTVHCRKLGVWPIISVEDIKIDELGSIQIDGQTLHRDVAETLAIMDGFVSLSDMVDWFDDQYGLPFYGDLTTWSPVNNSLQKVA